MMWKELSSKDQIQQIKKRSTEIPVAVFKHSTRCSISSMAKLRLEDDWDFKADELEIYYLDLIAHRDISSELAEQFQVHHESPQVLLIKNGECTYDASHLDITVQELKEVYQN